MFAGECQNLAVSEAGDILEMHYLGIVPNGDILVDFH